MAIVYKVDFSQGTLKPKPNSINAPDVRTAVNPKSVPPSGSQFVSSAVAAYPFTGLQLTVARPPALGAPAIATTAMIVGQFADNHMKVTLEFEAPSATLYESFPPPLKPSVAAGQNYGPPPAAPAPYSIHGIPSTVITSYPVTSLRFGFWAVSVGFKTGTEVDLDTDKRLVATCQFTQFGAKLNVPGQKLQLRELDHSQYADYVKASPATRFVLELELDRATTDGIASLTIGSLSTGPVTFKSPKFPPGGPDPITAIGAGVAIPENEAGTAVARLLTLQLEVL